MPDTFHGYETRKPFAGEDAYFKKNAHVAGMAGEDGRIVLNPYSKNTPQQQQVVARNEAIRIWLKDNKVKPKFKVTPEQLKLFKGTIYEKPENILQLKHTLMARWLTGDPSGGTQTEMQKKWAEWAKKELPR